MTPRSPLLLLPFLVLPGCFTEVHGDPPRTACGTDNVLAESVIVGTEATWAGRTLTARGQDVKFWVHGGQADLPDDQWWGRQARAWAVAALSPGEKPDVVEARAGLVQYGSQYTTVRVGPAGQSFPAESGIPAMHEIIGPVALAPGESVLVVGAADARVSALGLRIRWQGCAETGPILWGVGEGFVAAWGDLEGPIVVAHGSGGALAYEAKVERNAPAGIVIAQAPPGGDPTTMNEAKVTTSRGTKAVTQVDFLVHDGGRVVYEITHAGETGREPLVAFLPIELAVAS